MKKYLAVTILLFISSPGVSVAQFLTSTQITLVTDHRHPERLGGYMAEILKTEGFLDFEVVGLRDLNADVLNKTGFLILTESRLNGHQLKEIPEWVKRGGLLVGLRPDPRLAEVFGVRYRFEGFETGYMRTNPQSRLGRQTETEALQLHTRPDLYDLQGAEAAFYVLRTPEASPKFPAITTHRLGKGRAVLSTYNLAKNIVWTRQGDPNEVDKENDFHRGALRASDLFIGMLDSERRISPQADIQQAIFAKALAMLLAQRQPVPVIWKFPNAKPAVVIMIGDHHGEDKEVVEEIELVEKYNGSMTIYVMSGTRSHCSDPPRATPETQPDRETILSWRRGRHEVAQHLNLSGLEGWGTNYLDPLDAEATITESLRAFYNIYRIKPRTARAHGIQWLGWVEQARMYARNGVQMSLDYVSIGPLKRSMGYMCGSGLAMRFVDERGQILNIFHQPTQFEDDVVLYRPPQKARLRPAARCPEPESLPGMGLPYDALTTSKALQQAGRMFRESADRYHTPLSFNIHPPFFASYSGDFLRGSLELARKFDMPVLSAERLRVRFGHGQALLFAFDPVLTVVYHRQGNPEKANREIDGADLGWPEDWNTITASEMMAEGWWDPDLVRVPQADLLQRLLVDSLRELAARPLPSIWYFPHRSQSMLFMTGDVHRAPEEIIEKYLTGVEKYGSTASLYLLPPVEEKWTPEQVEAWVKRGHEVSVHSDHILSADHGREVTWRTLEDAVRNFEKTYDRPVRTVRNDWLTWYGWVDQARMQQQLGILMDLNYVTKIPAYYGYMFGSSLPMRFVDSTGKVIDHYQQPTLFEDDIVMKSHYGAFNTEQATELSIGMLQDSLQGYYNSVCLNVHPQHYESQVVGWNGYSGEWARRTMQYAQKNRIPIWSAGQWLDFILARNQAEMEDLQRTESSCSFRLVQPKPIEGLTLLLPTRYGNRQLDQVTVEGSLQSLKSNRFTDKPLPCWSFQRPPNSGWS